MAQKSWCHTANPLYSVHTLKVTAVKGDVFYSQILSQKSTMFDGMGFILYKEKRLGQKTMQYLNVFANSFVSAWAEFFLILLHLLCIVIKVFKS